MTIAVAPSTDVQALSAVARATFLESFADTVPWADIALRADTEDSPEGIAALLDKGARCWIARVEHTLAPVGFCAVVAPDLPVRTAPGDLELKRIYALASVQGRGVGLRLLNAAQAHARESGAGALWLGVHHANPAVQWYERQGFGIAGERTFRVGNATFRDFVMRKAL